jgi:4-coumarate--CoA ligase
LIIHRNDAEFPRAYISLKETARRRKPGLTATVIEEWIKPQVVKYKWLVGGVVFVDEVPRLPSGKIKRKIMREWAERDAASLSQSTGTPKL